jgi:hypothetical protein
VNIDLFPSAFHLVNRFCVSPTLFPLGGHGEAGQFFPFRKQHFRSRRPALRSGL